MADLSKKALFTTKICFFHMATAWTAANYRKNTKKIYKWTCSLNFYTLCTTLPGRKKIMIEVEKKFKTLPAIGNRIKNGSVFVSLKNIDDVYYDFPDFRLIKKRLGLENEMGCLN
jgi:hypothetical protein